MRTTTNKQSAPLEHDPVLLPFLTAADDVAVDVALTSLLTDHIEPRLREIVSYKLRAYVGQREESEDRADVTNEIVLQLLSQLATLRDDPHQTIIRNFRSYVAVTAYRACYDYLRRKFPNRYNFKHKLRYALTHAPALACWQLPSSDEWVGGLVAWRGDEPVRSEARLQELRTQTPAHVRTAAQQSDLTQSLVTFFGWAGQPLELDELVGIVAELQGLTEKSFVRGEQAEDAIAQVADQRSSVVDELTARAYLKHLWQEVAQLTPRHCAALLLNLRDEQGGCAIDLLLCMGVASLAQIAAAMAMTEAELCALWQHLPLEDAVIAERLQITRQQVINLRRSARERLARRLREGGF